MLHKTRGIVFRITPYGETSIIASIFTEHFGLQSYIINGVRTRTKGKIALYQPLTLLELVVYYKENANLLRIKEVKCFHPYQTISSDYRKSTIAMFINEVMNKSVKDQSHAQDICAFLFHSLITFDELTGPIENFHLIFLIQLSRHLGFGASFSEEITQANYVAAEDKRIIDQLLKADFLTVLHIQNIQRRNILDILLRFYVAHLDNFGEMKSLAVLREMTI